MENPYQSPAVVALETSSDRSDKRITVSRMWLAYLIAPGIAPLAFIVQLFALGILCTIIGREVNPVSFAIMPGLALTAGMIASYAVAGFIGMPIAFVLRGLGVLNFYSVHLSAFAWCCVFAAISRCFIAGDGIPEGYAATWFLYVLVLTGPPILLSATMFWLITRKPSSPENLAIG